MKPIKRLIDGHKFFVKETPSFVGNKSKELSVKDKLYYPIAYIKFMWLTLINK